MVTQNTMLPCAPRYVVWADHLGTPVAGGCIPGSVNLEIFPESKKFNMHIDCLIEAELNKDNHSIFQVFNMDAIKESIGASSITWNATYQSRVTIESAAEYGTSIPFWGRTGLRFTPDGSICRSFLPDLMVAGYWGTEHDEIWRVGNYIHIDVWGADYS